jgi:hypothetical protein
MTAAQPAPSRISPLSHRLVIVALVIAATAAMAWVYRDSEPVRRVGADASALVRSVLPERAERALTSVSPGAGGLRKCRSGANVLYTNSVCPAGSREEVVAGSLTVVPGQPVASEPARPPNVLRSLSGPGLDDLRKKHIEQVIER